MKRNGWSALVIAGTLTVSVVSACAAELPDAIFAGVATLEDGRLLAIVAAPDGDFGDVNDVIAETGVAIQGAVGNAGVAVIAPAEATSCGIGCTIVNLDCAAIVSEGGLGLDDFPRMLHAAGKTQDGLSYRLRAIDNGLPEIDYAAPTSPAVVGAPNLLAGQIGGIVREIPVLGDVLGPLGVEVPADLSSPDEAGYFHSAPEMPAEDGLCGASGVATGLIGRGDYLTLTGWNAPTSP